MFTGIIEEVGNIISIKRTAASIRLTIAADKVLNDTVIGDSIAVNGTCLTVTKRTDKDFTADVTPESVRKTALDELHIGSPVNLERALQLSSRLGGHIVSGHIDGTGTLLSKKPEGNSTIVTIKADKDVLHYIVKKGSVTIDGISLTVVDANEAKFSISLIPHTTMVTTIDKKSAGALVNIETDILGKYVEKMLFTHKNDKSDKQSPIEKCPTSHVSMDFLNKNGFY